MLNGNWSGTASRRLLECWEHFALAHPHVSPLGLCLFFVLGCL